jgi:hypothetical protein
MAMGLGEKRELQLRERDESFDLAMAVMRYDEALHSHPDAPSLRAADPAVAEVQSRYEEMRERAKDIVARITGDSVKNSRP